MAFGKANNRTTQCVGVLSCPLKESGILSLNDSFKKVDTEPVTPVNTNSDYEYEEDILPTYMK